jgi:voltage-gated potassium channel
MAWGVLWISSIVKSQLFRIVSMLVSIPLLGALGFMLIEGWDFYDALYMAVITITTVGFREVHELSRSGQLFVITYLLLGFGTFFYGLLELGGSALRAELGNWLGKRRMDMILKALQGHVIVCGFGRMGAVVCRHLAAKKVPFVVIERDAAAAERCTKQGWPILIGDATDDQTLLEAGIARARGLATVLSEDADNVYVVLSARMLEKTLPIAARASDEKSVPKLRKAGADRIVSLYETGAAKMSEVVVNPNVEDFAEIAAAEGRELDVAELHIDRTSPHAGRAVGATELATPGVVVVGIKRKDGQISLNPPPSAMIDVDDALIVLGKSDGVAQLLASHRPG